MASGIISVCILQAAEVMAQMQQVIGRGMPASLLARSPTVVGLAETLAAMPAVDPSAEFAIPRAPFTPAQKAAGVPCSLRQEDMARRFLVRASLTSHRLLEGFWSRKVTLTFCPSCVAFPLPLQTVRQHHHSEICKG